MSKVIALIDDDDGVRSSMASLIRSFGLAVRTFESAEAFLACGERAFACVITDFDMPRLSGLDLERVVSGWVDPPPVIIITAFPQRVQAASGGQTLSVIEKPVDASKLLERMTTLIGPFP